MFVPNFNFIIEKLRTHLSKKHFRLKSKEWKLLPYHSDIMSRCIYRFFQNYKIKLSFSIWKFGFSDFRNYSFSVSKISFVYTYTKEISETLKEYFWKSENSRFQIVKFEIIIVFHLTFLISPVKFLCTKFQLHYLIISCTSLIKTNLQGMKILRIENVVDKVCLYQISSFGLNYFQHIAN